MRYVSPHEILPFIEKTQRYCEGRIGDEGVTKEGQGPGQGDKVGLPEVVRGVKGSW